MKYLFILLLTVTVFAFDYPITLQEVASYSGDLAGYWKLQGNALDYSKNDNDGTVHGAVSTGTNYYFDGINDYIDCGTNFNFNNGVTYIWQHNLLELNATTGYSPLGRKYNDGPCIEIYNYGNVTNIGVYKKNGTGWQMIKYHYDIPTNECHQFAFTFDPITKLGKLYIDGTFKESHTFSDGTFKNTEKIYIGRRTNGNYFQGYIKDVRIYDKALTTEEVSNIYNETLLKHTINLFDSKPATVTDLSDEGNDGTVYGATMTDDGMSFNGVNEYIVSKDIRPTELTISMWLYLTEDTVGECIGKYYNAGGFSYRMKRNGNQLEYHMNSIAHFARIPIGDNTQKWIHVTVTYDKEYQRIYINNIEGTPLAKTVEIPYSANPVYLGRASLGYYLKCKEDNVAIYDRVITSDERAALVAAGRNASKDVISTNGLVLFYDFDVPERALTLQEPTWYYGDMASWWKLQGNALDYSQNDNNGTVVGAVSTGTNYYFDGVNDTITADSSIEYPFTLCAWVNASQIDSTFLSVGDSGDTKYFAILLKADGFYARVYDGASTKDSKLNVSYTGWHFVVGVFASSTSRQIYVDGMAGTESTSTANAVAVNRAVIGVTADSTPANYFKGYIKDCRIYDKALTADEINKIYNSTK